MHKRLAVNSSFFQGALAGLAGLWAAFSNAAPTGLAWWDKLLVITLAILVTASARKLEPWILLLALALTAPFAAPTVAIPAVVAIGLIAFCESLPFDRRLAAAAAGAVIANAALRIQPEVGPLNFFGASSVLAALAFALVLVPAYRKSGTRTHKTVRRSGGVLALASVTALVGTGAMGLTARSAISLGSASAEAGLKAARNGQTEQAALDLRTAEENWHEARTSLSSVWTAPGRLVPVLSQHVEVGRQVSAIAEEISGTAAIAVSSGSAENLRSSEGRLNLELMSAMQKPLRDVEASLVEAQATLNGPASPWLLPPVVERLDLLRGEIESALPEAQNASDAARVFPLLAGADEPKTYLVLFGTPAESRELGGFLGNFLELTMANGDARISASGRTADLMARGPGTLESPDSYPVRFMTNNPELFPQNWTGMPDFPSVARAVGELYPSIGGHPLDGVIYVDPIGLAALVEFTGPLEVPELGLTLGADTLAEFLLIDQYVLIAETPERADLLDQLSVQTFAKLLTAELPSPKRIADVLGPVTRGGHLQLTTFDHDANQFLERVHLNGAFPKPDGGDFLSVVQGNAAANKIDSYLERTVTYDVDVSEETGELAATLTVELFNAAPPDLPDYILGNDKSVPGKPRGTNLVHLSAYTPHFLESVSIDGTDVPAERQQELGYQRFLVMVPVERGQTVSVEFNLTGSVELPDGVYHITVANQALANPDDMTINVSLPGADDRPDSPQTLRWLLMEDTELSFVPLNE